MTYFRSDHFNKGGSKGVLIAATEPLFKNNGRSFQGISRYRQKVPEDAEGATLEGLREKVDEIREQMEKHWTS
jgi:hypothetical protein